MLKRSLSLACAAILGLLVFHGHASAQSFTRLCVATYDVNSGVTNCEDNGWQPKLLAGLTTTVTSVKSSNAGQLGQLYCYNPNASAAYIQVFDVAKASGVTLGTTVPVASFGFAATTGASVLNLTALGIHFANGIQVAATTTATGLTAPSTALDCSAAYN